VDARSQGWHARPPRDDDEAARAARTGDAHLYECVRRDEPPGTYEELWTRVGPLRPVVPPSRAELRALELALTRAGTRALPTLCAALYRVAVEYVNGLPEPHHERLTYGECLTAADPGSHAADIVETAAWDIGARIGSGRLDERALLAVSEILRSWARDPARQVDVAASLAYVLGRVIDAAGGYRRVCDQWLREHKASDPVDGKLRHWACSMSSHRRVPARWSTLRLIVAVNPPPEMPAQGRVAAIAQALADAVTDPALFNPRVRAWPMYAELWYLPPLDPANAPDTLPITLVCALHAQAAGDDAQCESADRVPAADDLVTAAHDTMTAGLRALTDDAGTGLSLLPIGEEEYTRAQRHSAGAFISGGRRPGLAPPDGPAWEAALTA
jgi:hypothetical protein